MIRRGATYGPALPDGAPDDGVDRGIAAFIICADLVRQFEFAQNVWINDRAFHELGNEHDPICGTQDGTMEFTIPKRPIRKVLKGLPAFTTLQGGAYFFLPGTNGPAVPGDARQLRGTMSPARTYNQNHVPRKHIPGRRRISIYWTWSYPWEAQRDPAAMYNRFSTMTEVRNALWPSYETPEYDEAHFLQGIAGTLELFHRSTLAFQELAGEATGHPVAVFQRIDQAGYRLPIDERILADTDTLMVFGLDHILSEQEADPDESTPSQQWLQREGTCLLLAPHHDVGFTDDYAQRQVEYQHHGDPLVPRQQRFGQYTRSLMTALEVPVHNTWGLRPAVVEGTTADRTADRAPRSGRRETARQRDHVQLPPPPAALRTHRTGERLATGPGPPTSRPQQTRTPSPRRATPNSMRSSGCHRQAGEPATSCSSTPPTSPRCSAAPTASRISGATWPP